MQLEASEIYRADEGKVWACKHKVIYAHDFLRITSLTAPGILSLQPRLFHAASQPQPMGDLSSVHTAGPNSRWYPHLPRYTIVPGAAAATPAGPHTFLSAPTCTNFIENENDQLMTDAATWVSRVQRVHENKSYSHSWNDSPLSHLFLYNQCPEQLGEI
jgi:hypothetical protein